MKKVLFLMGLFLVMILPLGVNAAENNVNLSFNCTEPDSNNSITCKVSYEIFDNATYNEMTVTVTEQGGATVTGIDNAAGSDWTIASKDNADKVWTIKLTGPEVTGEGDLFMITYKASGTKDCKILVQAMGKTYESPTPVEPDTTEPNKDTGATLPFIALGTISLVAVGAYLATRNKTKMYKI